MERAEKEQIVAEVSEVLKKAKGLYFTDFTGLTVAQATELRREFRKAGIDYKVVKNTLIKKALGDDSGYDSVRARLVGPTAVAFAYDDVVTPAKIIQKFIEKHEKLSLKAAVLERHFYDGSKLDELAKLPSRPEMMAAILGSIQAPLATVPGAVNAILRDLVSVVGEVAKTKAA